MTPSQYPDFMKRVFDERNELDDKSSKLQTYLYINPASQALTHFAYGLMVAQLHTMRMYSEILNKRIIDWEQTQLR